MLIVLFRNNTAVTARVWKRVEKYVKRVILQYLNTPINNRDIVCM